LEDTAMTAMKMNVTIAIANATDFVLVSLVVQGQDVKKYLESDNWSDEKMRLLEQFRHYSGVVGSIIDDKVKFQIAIPRHHLQPDACINTIAETIVGASTHAGWREERHIIMPNEVSVDLVEK
jgi:hypothetical protein